MTIDQKMDGDREKTSHAASRKPPTRRLVQKGKAGKSDRTPKQHVIVLTLASILAALDNEEIVVLDNGIRTRMTKLEIEFRQMSAAAIDGDLKAAEHLLWLDEEYFAQKAAGGWENDFITPKQAKRRFGRNWIEKVKEWNSVMDIQ